MSNNPHHPHAPSGSGDNKSAIAIAAVGATISGVAAAVSLSKVIAPRTGAGYVKRSRKKLDEAQELAYKKREEDPAKYIIPLARRNKLTNEQLIPVQNELTRLQGLTKTFVGSAWNWSDSQELYRASDYALAEVQRISGEEALAYKKRKDDERLKEQRRNQGLHNTNSGPSGHQQEISNYYGPTSGSHRNQYSSMSTDSVEDLEILEERRGSSSSQIPYNPKNPYAPPLSIESNRYDSYGQPSSKVYYGYPPRDRDQGQSLESSPQSSRSSIRSHGQTSSGYNAHNPPLGDREQAHFSETSQPRSASIRTRNSKTSHDNPPLGDREQAQFSESSEPRDPSIRSHGQTSSSARNVNPPLGDREQRQISESYPQSCSSSDAYERHGQSTSVQVYDYPRREIEHDRASKASSRSGGSEHYSTRSYRSNTSNVSEYHSARSHISTNSNVSAHSSASQHVPSQLSSTTNFPQYPPNNYQGPGPSYDNNAQNYGANYTQGQGPAKVQHSTYSNASQSSSASKKSRSAAAKKQ